MTPLLRRIAGAAGEESRFVDLVAQQPLGQLLRKLDLVAEVYHALAGQRVACRRDDMFAFELELLESTGEVGGGKFAGDCPLFRLRKRGQSPLFQDFRQLLGCAWRADRAAARCASVRPVASFHACSAARRAARRD